MLRSSGCGIILQPAITSSAEPPKANHAAKRYIARGIYQHGCTANHKVIPRLKTLDQHRSINALAETINGLHKAEVTHRRGPWRSYEAVEYATLEWVDWFNHRRLLESIGNVPPAEADEQYHAAAEFTDMKA